MCSEWFGAHELSGVNEPQRQHAGMARCWARAEGSGCVAGAGFLSGAEHVLQLNVGGGCITLCVYLMPLNCTLLNY